MQQRRGGSRTFDSSNIATSSGSLPMTVGDLPPLISRQARRRKRRGKKAKSFFVCGFKFWSGLTLAVMGGLVIFVVRSLFDRSTPQLSTLHGKIPIEKERQALHKKSSVHVLAPKDGARKEKESIEKKLPLPLSQFSTLNRALANADLVGVYFAAAWCPMSTPVTTRIAEIFPSRSGVLLPPWKQDEQNTTTNADAYPFALVYVSSDRDEASMIDYAKEGWINVPFETDERSSIKKHFLTCAEPELSELGIDRKFEIPTLMILDGKTHDLITMTGAEDLKGMGSDVLEHWQGLQNAVRGLES